nr:PREDICTED: microtubule-associated protein 1S-like [Equus przewalskii]
MRFSASCRASTRSPGAGRGASRGPPQPRAPGRTRADPVGSERGRHRRSGAAQPREQLRALLRAEVPPKEEREGRGRGTGVPRTPAGRRARRVDVPGRRVLSRAPRHPGTDALGHDAPPTAVCSGAACVTEPSLLQLFHECVCEPGQNQVELFEIRALSTQLGSRAQGPLVFVPQRAVMKSMAIRVN